MTWLNPGPTGFGVATVGEVESADQLPSRLLLGSSLEQFKTTEDGWTAEWVSPEKSRCQMTWNGVQMQLQQHWHDEYAGTALIPGSVPFADYPQYLATLYPGPIAVAPLGPNTGHLQLQNGLSNELGGQGAICGLLDGFVVELVITIRSDMATALLTGSKFVEYVGRREDLLLYTTVQCREGIVRRAVEYATTEDAVCFARQVAAEALYAVPWVTVDKTDRGYVYSVQRRTLCLSMVTCARCLPWVASALWVFNFLKNRIARRPIREEASWPAFLRNPADLLYDEDPQLVAVLGPHQFGMRGSSFVDVPVGAEAGSDLAEQEQLWEAGAAEAAKRIESWQHEYDQWVGSDVEVLWQD
jgi:hypothetical protein